MDERDPFVAAVEPRVAPALSATAEREAVRGAAFVAGCVLVPAVLAAGTVLTLFALTSAVLLAPAIAGVLTWTAWRYAHPRPEDARRRSGVGGR